MVEARAGVEPTYTDLQTRGLHRSAISKQKDASCWPPAALKPSSTPEFFTIETVLKCGSEECWTAMKSQWGLIEKCRVKPTCSCRHLKASTTPSLPWSEKHQIYQRMRIIFYRNIFNRSSSNPSITHYLHPETLMFRRILQSSSLRWNADLIFTTSNGLSK